MIAPALTYFSRKACLIDPKIFIDEDLRLGFFLSFSEYWLNKQKRFDRDFALFKQVVTLQNNEEAVAIDVGANIGLTSLGLWRAGFRRIFAFEPIAQTRRRLLQNIWYNGLDDHILVVPFGLGNKRGTVSFIIPNRWSSEQNKIAPNTESARSFALLTNIEEAVVERLNIFMGILKQPVSLIKIDVEGFEPLVVGGAEEMLGEGSVAFLFIEVIEKALEETGWTMEPFEVYLFGIGFFSVVFKENNQLEEVSLRDALIEAGDTRNVLLRHRAAR